MFKRQHNESPYVKTVTATETVFTNHTFARQLLVKKCESEVHENLTIFGKSLLYNKRTDVQMWSAFKAFFVLRGN